MRILLCFLIFQLNASAGFFVPKTISEELRPFIQKLESERRLLIPKEQAQGTRIAGRIHRAFCHSLMGKMETKEVQNIHMISHSNGFKRSIYAKRWEPFLEALHKAHGKVHLIFPQKRFQELSIKGKDTFTRVLSRFSPLIELHPLEKGLARWKVGTTYVMHDEGENRLIFHMHRHKGAYTFVLDTGAGAMKEATLCKLLPELYRYI